jgi:hypothetical protein
VPGRDFPVDRPCTLPRPRSTLQRFDTDFGGRKVYRMLPRVFGFYAFQFNRLDRESREPNEEHREPYSSQFFRGKPQLMQVVPVEKEITGARAGGHGSRAGGRTRASVPLPSAHGIRAACSPPDVRISRSSPAETA